jgi:hypothetical protein
MDIFESIYKKWKEIEEREFRKKNLIYIAMKNIISILVEKKEIYIKDENYFKTSEKLRSRMHTKSKNGRTFSL